MRSLKVCPRTICAGPAPTRWSPIRPAFCRASITSGQAGSSVSKLMNAVKAGQGGVPRIHIIDGRVEEGLLGEVFSNEGIGTLVHTNLYQAIRPARKKDGRGINGLIRSGVENDELLPRSAAEI